jgi:hypothetical protein
MPKKLKRMHYVYFAAADVVFKPNAATDSATEHEVYQAIANQNLDVQDIEHVDHGMYNIPLTPGQAKRLERDGHLEFIVNIKSAVQFSLEMP